jgi:hypothetical protein
MGPFADHAQRTTLCVALALLCICGTGCVNSIKGAIPARCLSPDLSAAYRDHMAPIDFTLLRQDAPPAHLIGADDILGVYIQDVLGKGEEPPDARYPPTFGSSASGNFTSPAVGTPITVRPDGTIALPLIPPVAVQGMTLAEATERIKKTYTDEQSILQPGREVVFVSLIRPRSAQVLVLREDTMLASPVVKPRDSTIVSKRGTASVIDLPVYQNDVLHALTLTGGLPGSDASNEVLVLHGAKNQWDMVVAEFDSHGEPSKLVASDSHGQARLVRIPLRVLPGDSPGFTVKDVILDAGDVLFIPSRDTEHFFAGGLLPGGQFPLPRDYDLDVIGAIAVTGGSAAGPAGTNAASYLYRGGSGPGNIVPPTRVIILRTVDWDQQLMIHVDLKRALHDRKERLAIRPGDVVMLQYTPGELLSNYILNLFNFNLNITRTFFTPTQ